MYGTVARMHIKAGMDDALKAYVEEAGGRTIPGSVAVYVYLFATVSGSLSLELGFVSAHPGWTVVIVIGTIVLLLLLGRFFWHRAAKLREQLATGGAVLGQPRRFMVGVVLPAAASFASVGRVTVHHTPIPTSRRRATTDASGQPKVNDTTDGCSRSTSASFRSHSSSFQCGRPGSTP